MFVRGCLHGQNPQAACDAPRWHVTPQGDVLLETGVDEAVIRGLSQRGCKTVVSGYGDPFFGGAQAILVMPRGYCAASDPRRDGQAVAV